MQLKKQKNKTKAFSHLPPTKTQTVNVTSYFPPSENENKNTHPLTITTPPQPSSPSKQTSGSFSTKHVRDQPALLPPQAPRQSTSHVLLEQATANLDVRRGRSEANRNPVLKMQRIGCDERFSSGQRRDCFFGLLNQRFFFRDQGSYERSRSL